VGVGDTGQAAIFRGMVRPQTHLVTRPDGADAGVAARAGGRGRIGQPGTVRETEFEVEGEACAAVEQVWQRKEKRGYWTLAENRAWGMIRLGTPRQSYDSENEGKGHRVSQVVIDKPFINFPFLRLRRQFHCTEYASPTKSRRTGHELLVMSQPGAIPENMKFLTILHRLMANGTGCVAD
jgi:hypothetical protein